MNIGDIAAEVAQPEGLDAGSLLKDVRRGQGNGQWQSKSTGRIGTGDVNTNDIGGDLANQIVGGGSSSVDQILNNLNGHKQGTNTSNTSQGQRKGHGQGGLQGQSNGRQNGGNAQIIEIKETIIIEANGQRFKTVGIHAERSKSQGASSPIMTAQTQIAPLAGGLNATVCLVFPSPFLSCSHMRRHRVSKLLLPHWNLLVFNYSRRPAHLLPKLGLSRY